MISVNAAGTDSGNSTVGDGVLFSPDGTKVAFTTAASDLGATDTNGYGDVYLRDLTTGTTTTLVTDNAAGTATSNGSSTLSGVSPDGTTVAFGSTANDLGPADTNTGNPEDITKVLWEHLVSALYVYDLASGATTLVRVDADATGGANGSVGGGWLSSDGTKVGFATTASNLGPHDTNGVFDIYVRDLVTQTTTLVSSTADGANGGNAPSFGYAMSPDGSQVLFGSLASDLGPVDTNGMRDVYVRDLTANDLGGNDTVMCRRPAGPSRQLLRRVLC